VLRLLPKAMFRAQRKNYRNWAAGDTDLANAVAPNSTSFNSARMIGPAAAGILIAQIGTGWAFMLNGISFTAVLISLLSLSVASLHPHGRTARRKGGVTEGFRYAWSRPDLKAVLIMLFLIGTFGLNLPIFISTMAVRVFHTDARGCALLSSIMAVGTIAGALLAAGRERPKFISLLADAAVYALGCTPAAIAPSYWLFAAALVIIGVAAITFTNTTNSLMLKSHKSFFARLFFKKSRLYLDLIKRNRLAGARHHVDIVAVDDRRCHHQRRAVQP
jgi:hypothetical protein